MLTLIRQAGAIEAEPVDGVVLRSPTRDDAVGLGQLYFASYTPGVAAATPEEAFEDIELTFEGAYGVLDLDLSWLAWVGAELVGALLVVERAPWPDTPGCAFIVELFTAPTHRRLGIGRLLLAASANVTIALRVDENNVAALALYRRLGFRHDEAGSC